MPNYKLTFLGAGGANVPLLGGANAQLPGKG
jgi:hypothetical protein